MTALCLYVCRLMVGTPLPKIDKEGAKNEFLISIHTCFYQLHKRCLWICKNDFKTCYFIKQKTNFKSQKCK